MATSDLFRLPDVLIDQDGIPVRVDQSDVPRSRAFGVSLRREFDPVGLQTFLNLAHILERFQCFSTVISSPD